MQIASALSTLSSAPAIAQDIEEQFKKPLAGRRPDLILLFISMQLSASFEELLALLRTSLKPRQMVAVTAESIIGLDQEVERSAAVSAMSMTLDGPNALITAFHLGEEEWPELLG